MKFEIKEIDGKSVANMITLFMIVSLIVSFPLVLVLTIFGIKIEMPFGATSIWQVYLNGLLFTAGLYITIRLNVWIYNLLSKRFGGLVIYTNENINGFE